MTTTRDKGDEAELAIAADLLRRGYKVAIPFGQGWDYDLILVRDRRFERVQVKYTEEKDGVIIVRARCHSVVKGKVSRTKVYTSEHVDWVAVYEKKSGMCYYLPSSMLNTSTGLLTIRTASKKKHPDIRWAKDYETI
jgi:hypothetical protein